VTGIRLAPSILSANFAELGRDIAAVERGGADLIHVDVMDGRFVPNITIGPPVVRAIKGIATRPLDVHLMIEEPDRYVDDFVNAGAAMLSVHVEAVRHLHRTIALIKVRRVREMLDRAGSSAPIEVDGGIDAANAAKIVAAGASILVAGHAIFDTPDAEAATRALRAAVCSACGSHA
jgi:ribulose-phosphate 3-epimerase